MVTSSVKGTVSRVILSGAFDLLVLPYGTEMVSNSVSCEMGEPWKGVALGRHFSAPTFAVESSLP